MNPVLVWRGRALRRVAALLVDRAQRALRRFRSAVRYGNPGQETNLSTVDESVAPGPAVSDEHCVRSSVTQQELEASAWRNHTSRTLLSAIDEQRARYPGRPLPRSLQQQLAQEWTHARQHEET
jgi:HAMP domain-containing protein